MLNKPFIAGIPDILQNGGPFIFGVVIGAYFMDKAQERSHQIDAEARKNDRETVRELRKQLELKEKRIDELHDRLMQKAHDKPEPPPPS